MAVDYATLKKGGFMRQKQKNNFSLRLAVVGGNLTAKQLAKIAEVAEKYGDGHVHLTSRQGVEIPFIKLDQIDEVKAELEKGDCKPGVCGPRVRTVTACQGNQICQVETLIPTISLRNWTRDILQESISIHKFKFGVTGCQNNCLKSEENDVGVKGASIVKWKEDACIQCGVCVKACRTDAIKLEDGKIEVEESKCNYCGRCAKSCPTDAWDVTTGYLVSFGGLFGNRIHKGEEVVPVIKDEETLFRVTDAAIQFFDDNANPSERFRFTIERVGEDKFEKVIKEAYNG